MRSATETVVAGGNRSMRRKDDFAWNLAGCGVEVQPFFFHPGTNGLKDRESAMAFIQMQHAGRDAHGLQRAETANPEQKFLANARA